MSYQAKITAIDARITKLQAKRAELIAKFAADVSVRVAVGDAIEFKYGRAEKVRSVVGVVVGRKSQEKGADLLRVQIGENFDTAFVTIYPNAVTSILAVETTPAN